MQIKLVSPDGSSRVIDAPDDNDGMLLEDALTDVRPDETIIFVHDPIGPTWGNVILPEDMPSGPMHVFRQSFERIALLQHRPLAPTL